MIDSILVIVSVVFFTFLFTSFFWNICFVRKQDEVIIKLREELFDLRWGIPLKEQKAREEGYQQGYEDSETNQSYDELLKLSGEFLLDEKV